MTAHRAARSLIAAGVTALVASVLVVAWTAGAQDDGGSSAVRSSTSSSTVSVPANPTTSHPHVSSTPVAIAPLRAGERWVTLPMPGGTYEPQGEAGGTDDYRCILLDPKFGGDADLSGVVLEPGNPTLVHHAILYRVEKDQLAAAKAEDKKDPRLGWSCFGGPTLRDRTEKGPLAQLNSAPWVAAWATDGGEQRFAAGTGQRMPAGSQVILQMHYNLLNGDGADNTTVKLRVAPSSSHLKPLQTMLLPAPVELPCPAGETGALCNRDSAVLDVMRRFGPDSGRTVASLQLLCGDTTLQPKPGPTQTCIRPMEDSFTIQLVAGHMHMLGRSIQIDLERLDGSKQRLLDVPVWNFDDQRATVLSKPVTVAVGDKLRVTCTHDATLRTKLPALSKLQPRYVVWGEGSSDEMCLGIVRYTTP